MRVKNFSSATEVDAALGIKTMNIEHDGKTVGLLRMCVDKGVLKIEVWKGEVVPHTGD